MQHKAVYLLFCKFTLHVSGVNHTHHQDTQNCNYSLWYCAATSLQCGQAWPHWREVGAQKIWPVPEAVVTVFCTPDDGCGWHPKHVERTCRIINRLLCVASRWTIIIKNYLPTFPGNLSVPSNISCVTFQKTKISFQRRGGDGTEIKHAKYRLLAICCCRAKRAFYTKSPTKGD